MTEVIGRVALCVVGDGIVAYCGKFILPSRITISICDIILSEDITVVVIYQRITVEGRLIPSTVSSLGSENVTINLENC